MNKKQAAHDEMYHRIYEHAENLNQIFPDLGIEGDYAAHIKLCKRLRRLENRAHAIQERICNGELDLTDNLSDELDQRLLSSLDKIINFKKAGISVFINGDPRGYALKIDDEYVKEHNLDIHQDWGGYGIIAPDLSGE